MSLFRRSSKNKIKTWSKDTVCKTRQQATREAKEARKDGLEVKIGYVVYTRKR